MKTKELARQLGLLRKRSSTSSNGEVQKKHRKTAQLFNYLIVIDFESTCWEQKTYRAQEIIEFPAVLLNTATGEIESEFHYYVQPMEQPTLSAFCTSLTGITQAMVEDGIPLTICLKKFTNWLGELSKEKGIKYNCIGSDGSSKCTFVTWSDWDLGVCLQYECRRKQLRKPVELNSWIDLRATYRKFYQRKPNGLNGALQDLGIEFHGRQHSGLDDARNTAALAFRMMCDGCIMSITKTINMNHGLGNFPKPSTSTENVQPSKEARNKPVVVAVGKENTELPSGASRPVGASHLTGDDKVIKQSGSENVKSNSSASWNPFSSRNAGDQTAIATPAVPCMSMKTVHATKHNGTSTCTIASKNGSAKDISNVSKFKTPSPVSHQSTSLKTPSPASGASVNVLKATPPLCNCGRRTKRRVVQSPGPNVGRFFFSCPLGRHGADGKNQHGCGYFKWESPTGISPPGHSIKRPFTPPLPQPNFNTPQSSAGSKKCLGVRTCGKKMK